MKQNTKIKTFIFAAAASLGVAATASAQSANVAVPTPAAEASYGMLGSRYSGVAATYQDLRGGTPDTAHSLGFVYNQPINTNFDFTGSFNYAYASAAGQRLIQKGLDLGTTAYQQLEWGKPFVYADAGWLWATGAGVRDDSFTYKVGTGVEFQVTKAFTVSPYLGFFRATHFNSSEGDFGVKAAYRIMHDWSLTGGVQYDAVRHSSDTVEYTLGVNYHF